MRQKLPSDYPYGTIHVSHAERLVYGGNISGYTDGTTGWETAHVHAGANNVSISVRIGYTDSSGRFRTSWRKIFRIEIVQRMSDAAPRWKWPTWKLFGLTDEEAQWFAGFSARIGEPVDYVTLQYGRLSSNEVCAATITGDAARIVQLGGLRASNPARLAAALVANALPSDEASACLRYLDDGDEVEWTGQFLRVDGVSREFETTVHRNVVLGGALMPTGLVVGVMHRLPSTVMELATVTAQELGLDPDAGLPPPR